MRLFGLVVTTRTAIMRDRFENAQTDTVTQLRTLLDDPNHPLRQSIVKVARSAVKDILAEEREAIRERFEADPGFQEWARQRREHDLAQAEERR